jgi:hypothetical protein
MNVKRDSIENRLYSIDKLLCNSNLQKTNPLNLVNNSTETEKFEGNQNDKDDNKSLNTKYALNKQQLNFCEVMKKLNSNLLYIKSGSFGSTFKGISTQNNEVLEFAVKVVAYPKNEGYGPINNVMRPENAELCMLKLLSYFIIKKQTPHLILPLSTFNTNIKPFIEIWNNGTIDKFKRDDEKGTFYKNIKNDKYYEIVIKYTKNKNNDTKKNNYDKDVNGKYCLGENNKMVENESKYLIRSEDFDLVDVSQDTIKMIKNTKEKYIRVNTKYAEFINNYKQGYFFENVSILISEWANRGDLATFLKKKNNENELPNFEKLNLIQWKCIFFQIISTLAIIQLKYPSFRHNDLKANNILVSKITNPTYQTAYLVDNIKYTVPNIGYCTYLWDFDFACIPDVINNKKLFKNWTQENNIKPVKNRYYDVHYFFCTLVYKGFLPQIMSSNYVPKEVKEFIDWIIPYEYRPIEINTKVHPEKCRMLVDDEVHLPVDILQHEFFKVFRK